MTRDPHRDPALTAAFWAVGGVGLVASGVSFAAYGLGTAFSVLAGALVAFANLWVHARVVKMYLAGGGRVWAVIGLVKVTLLFGLIYLLVRRDVVSVMPLIAGYGALPLGILASHLRPQPGPVTEER
jgi:hypothetical protein